MNAFYSSSFNTINFPAGILQPPFYDPAWDDALNYGAIGAVIGHEMTHGFDDRGRQFDGDGNMRDWWTGADASRYKDRASRVASQFDGYTAVDTVHVNGRLTLGENIADLGGLAVAYAAFEKAHGGKAAPARRTVSRPNSASSSRGRACGARSRRPRTCARWSPPTRTRRRRGA